METGVKGSEKPIGTAQHHWGSVKRLSRAECQKAVSHPRQRQGACERHLRLGSIQTGEPRTCWRRGRKKFSKDFPVPLVVSVVNGVIGTASKEAHPEKAGRKIVLVEFGRFMKSLNVISGAQRNQNRQAPAFPRKRICRTTTARTLTTRRFKPTSRRLKGLAMRGWHRSWLRGPGHAWTHSKRGGHPASVFRPA